MAYMPEMHYCLACGVYLGPDNGDGICAACDMTCPECGQDHPANVDCTPVERELPDPEDAAPQRRHTP